MTNSGVTSFGLWSGLVNRLPLTLRLALRDLKGGLRGFRVFIACLILGVAAIAGVGSLSSAIIEGLRQEGRSLLGGDIELRLNQRTATPDELAFLEAAGPTSRVDTLRAMVRSGANDKRTLAEIKAVDGLYPLYGAVSLDRPGLSLDAALSPQGGVWGAVVAPELAHRLGLQIGDPVQVGTLNVTVRAILIREPDRANEGLELAPRLMLAAGALAATGLVQEGSLIRHIYRVELPPSVGLKTWEASLEARFPDAGWQLRDRDDSAPRVRDFAERAGLFLTLVGLTTLVVGGVGIGGAVRSYLDGKTATIATLKTLGATSGLIARVYVTQILLVAAAAVVVGLALGALFPSVVAKLTAEALPVPPHAGLYPLALTEAALYGVLVVLTFAIAPLTAARRVPPAVLFRGAVNPARGKITWPTAALMAGLAGILLGLPFLGTDNPAFIAGFEGGASAALAVLLAAGWAIRAGAARLPHPRHPAFRLALANLHRPGAPTIGVVLALGLGLTLFATLALIEGNLRRQIQENLPEEAPAFFFVDLRRDQIDDFTATARAISGVTGIEAVPYLRGQITRLNDVPVEKAHVNPDSRWALNGDRGLTFSAHLPADNRLTAGAWWPEGYNGPPQISFDRKLAEGMGLGVGDHMTITVLGREIEAEIASLRDIEWGTLSINFAIVFDPATLSAAPYSYLATLQADPSAEETAYRVLTDRFPNVSAVRMKEVLTEVNRLIGDMGAAVRAAALVTIFAGILVLAGATAAGARERIFDAVILKIFGGTRSTVMLMLLAEYLLLGLVTGVIAAGLGTVAAWVVATKVMGVTWVFLPWTVFGTIAVSILLTIAFGLAGTWAALTVRPAPALRALAT